jgi:hypothetical protein
MRKYTLGCVYTGLEHFGQLLDIGYYLLCQRSLIELGSLILDYLTFSRDNLNKQLRRKSARGRLY